MKVFKRFVYVLLMFVQLVFVKAQAKHQWEENIFIVDSIASSKYIFNSIKNIVFDKETNSFRVWVSIFNNEPIGSPFAKPLGVLALCSINENYALKKYEKLCLADSVIVVKMLSTQSDSGFFYTAPRVIDFDAPIVFKEHNFQQNGLLCSRTLDTSNYYIFDLKREATKCLRFEALLNGTERLGFSQNSGTSWNYVSVPEANNNNLLKNYFFVSPTTIVSTVISQNSPDINPKTRTYIRDFSKDSSWLFLGCSLKGYETDTSSNIRFLDFTFAKGGICFGVVHILKTNDDYSKVDALVKSTDTGRTWEVIHYLDKLSPDEYFYYVTAIDDNHIVASSNYGRIQKIDIRDFTSNWIVSTFTETKIGTQTSTISNFQRPIFKDTTTALCTIGNGTGNRFKMCTLKETQSVSVENVDEFLSNGKEIWIDKIYPSPAITHVQVDFNLSKDIAMNEVDVVILDIEGREISRQNLSAIPTRSHVYGAGWHTAVLPSSFIGNGVYIVKFSTTRSSSSKTFVKG